MELFIFSASTFRTFDRDSVLPGQLVTPGSVLPDEALLTILKQRGQLARSLGRAIPLSPANQRPAYEQWTNQRPASHLTLVAGLTAPDNRGRMWIILENRFEGNICQHNVYRAISNDVFLE